MRRQYVGGFGLEQRDVLLRNELVGRAERVAADERTRVARELHDVIAHGLGVVVVQATAARYALDRSRDDVAVALDAIREAGSGALQETRRVLGLLRGSDGESRELSPQPTVANHEALVGQFRAAGLDVEFDASGDLSVLDAATQLVVYRLIEEALTNTLKHADAARAEIHLGARDSEVTVDVSDDGRAVFRVDATEGHGQTGMRERVAMLRGVLELGPREGGGYRVRARLPIGMA